MTETVHIGIVDDHQLFLKSLGLMLLTFENYKVVLEASNGKDLQNKINCSKTIPDIILLDVNMPVMDGIETAKWLSENHPTIKTVALSMNDDDHTIIDMIKAGSCAYLMKDTHPNELEKALNEIYLKGYYNGDASNINYRRLLKIERDNIVLTEKEKTFVQFVCSELTYKEIAYKMNLSERTIDGYRENMFQKFNVQSRVGLCLELLRRKIINL
ncbi:MAG: DNA-binding response regulator [Pseudopedobacter saltans]|uniref:DNA-binding response regulator n=1 Tax=Pseudopedobacter saltans TaxID=151895 RepID=A0A2W5F611_9SPHI|nr:MAG: DNA-binding response regulator [Pseudopedobacter saltans]